MDDSEQQHCFEFEDSRLGTKEYWDNFYDTELANFEDMGDEGEIWFGRTTELRMLKYIIERVPLSASICDLGCGNGSLLRKLRARGYTNLCGLDYSVNAVELAKRASSPSRLIEQQKIVRNSVPDITTNDIMMQRIDYQIADLTAQKLGNELHGRFHVLLDKGTLDAISLNSDRKRHLRNYHENICKMFTAHMDGDDCEVLLGTKETAVVPLVRRKCKQILIVVSCNFTKDELIDLLDFSWFSTLISDADRHRQI